MFYLTSRLVGRDSTKFQLLSLTLRGVVQRDITEGGKLPAEFNTYQVVEPNELIFCLFDIDETPRTVGISPHFGMITGAYNVYRCLPCCGPRYAFYYFLHIDSFKGLRPFYTGLRKVVRPDTFGNVKILAPPLVEQTQIAKFLDHETAKIDRLIEKQEALIRLLKEKRQAVISHAVTKGLNPHVPLKDSGIPWLGQVPAHWSSLQFKFLIRRIDQGKSPECEARLASLEEWGVLKSGCVNRGVFQENEHKALPANVPPAPAAEIKEGDLLMSRASGSTDLIGSVGLVGSVRPRLMMSDKIFRLQPEPGILPRFIWRLAASTPVRKQIELSINGAEGLANNITKESIGRLSVIRPPVEEQQAIIDHLETRCAQLDCLVGSAEQQITFLQERRTALISAAVTGKIDVRHWQPVVASKMETTTPDRN